MIGIVWLFYLLRRLGPKKLLAVSISRRMAAPDKVEELIGVRGNWGGGGGTCEWG